MPITLACLHRYPVKGLSEQPLDRVDLTPGEGLPHDRRFAITHGASLFDPAKPEWQPKRQFLMLMANVRLAQLDTAFDPDTGVLKIRRDGKQVASGNLTTSIGRELINQFFAAFMEREMPGVPKIVEAPDVSFTDTPDKLVSIINLASVTDLERVTRRPVDPVRFRGNLLIDGADPWQEFDWVGRDITIGDARLHVIERIGRCAATTVNPKTGERDINIPKMLANGFGHTDCGVYARVIEGGTIAVGQTLLPN